jgi:hypothetical protein
MILMAMLRFILYCHDENSRFCRTLDLFLQEGVCLKLGCTQVVLSESCYHLISTFPNFMFPYSLCNYLTRKYRMTLWT